MRTWGGLSTLKCRSEPPSSIVLLRSPANAARCAVVTATWGNHTKLTTPIRRYFGNICNAVGAKIEFVRFDAVTVTKLNNAIRENQGVRRFKSCYITGNV